MQKLYDLIDKLWQWISNIVFVRFQFDIEPAALEAAQKSGKLVFALTHGGFVEWLILSSWSRKQGLGAILVANRRLILLFAKPLYFLQVVFRRKRYADLILASQEGPRLIFMRAGERKRLFEPTETENLLADLITQAALPPQPDVSFVPVFICWRKHTRGAGRQLGEYLFGLSSNPNLIGKIWYLARKRTDSTVRALSAISLREKGTEGADVSEDSEVLTRARSLRRRITIAVNQEMRVILGPRYFSPHLIKETLMRDPEVQKVIAETAAEQNLDRKKVMATAYRYLTEIAANQRLRAIEVTYVLLTWLFNKVFDGLVTRREDLQKVRETMKAKPVVFVSCHRSHLDYLVVPYLMFLNDLVTPYIAAGINLAFWPIGSYLRAGGAFFIRRSFRGNKLYSVCLKKYVETLIRSRINIKFFIEGTRSRTGKMLPPAYGFLKMVLDSYHAGAVEDVALIPVAICYDEVLEEGSYSRELSGGAKEKESASGLIKSRKIVKRNIGKVYVRFADPITTKEVEKAAADQGMDRTLMLQKTAFQICKSINDVTPITPKSLVCATFLSHETEALTLEQVLRSVDYYTDYVRWAANDLSVPEGAPFKRAVEKTLRVLQKNNSVTVHETSPLRYEVEDGKRVSLNFYKNGAMHTLVIPAITLLAVREALAERNAADFGSEVIRRALALRNLLKFEFFFNPTHLFANEVTTTLRYFTDIKEEPLTREAVTGGLARRFAHPEDISLFTRLLGDLLESYLITGKVLSELGALEMDQKQLIQRILKAGQEAFANGEVYFAESLSTQNIGQALRFFENLDWLSIHKGADKILVNLKASTPQTDAAVQHFAALVKLMEKPLGTSRG